MICTDIKILQENFAHSVCHKLIKNLNFISCQVSPQCEKNQNEKMHIDELKIVLANIDGILSDNDLMTIIDEVDINENGNVKFEGKIICFFC